jgi:hypothetical protein
MVIFTCIIDHNKWDPIAVADSLMPERFPPLSHSISLDILTQLLRFKQGSSMYAMVYATDGSSKSQRLPGRGAGELQSNEGSLRYGGNEATSVAPTNNSGSSCKGQFFVLNISSRQD